MTDYSLIKALQQSGDKYTIVECGAGAVVSNALLSIPGASSMIHTCIQPYSKEAQHDLIGPFERSVSLEWVAQALSKIQTDALITQFQLQGKDDWHLTHGYIGVRGKFGEAIYHVSDYDQNTSERDDEEFHCRALQLEEVEKVALKLMYKHSVDWATPLNDLNIDGVFVDGKPMLYDVLNIMGKNEGTDMMIPFVEDGWERMEDWVRGANGLIIMRGSFNPLHHGHIALMEAAKKKYPGYKAAFMISMTNCRKPPVPPAEAIARAVYIKMKGYDTIFSSRPYFDSSTQFFKRRWPDLPVIYPAGMDTVNRFVQDTVDEAKHMYANDNDYTPTEGGPTPSKWNDDILETKGTFWHITQEYNWKNHKFLVFERQGQELNPYAKYFDNIIEIDSTYKDDGISSTKIRNGTQ